MADAPTVRPLPPTTVPVLDNNQFTLPWRLWLQNLGLNTADITALEAQIVAAQAAASAAQITANDALTIAEEALAAAGNTTIGPAGPPGPLVWMGQDEGGDNGWVIPGPAGANGVIGRDGQNGVPGLDGVDGEDAWPIPGPQGPQGNPGSGGGRTLLATVTTTAGQTSVTLMSSIPNTYRNLIVEVIGGTTNASTTTSDHIGLRFNNDSGSNYKYAGLSIFPTGTGTFGSNSATSVDGAAVGTGVAGQRVGTIRFYIMNYTTSATWQTLFIDSNFFQGNVGVARSAGTGIWNPAVLAAINRIDVIVSANAFTTGSIIYLYGE